MKPSILVVGLPLLVGGCTSTLPPDVLASADVEKADITRTSPYQSPISGYVARRPVDPKPWRRQNELQSPLKGDAS